MRPLRQALTPAYRQQASLAAAALFIESEVFRQGSCFACYLATPEELETKAIIEALWQAGKSCYLPVVADLKAEKILSFAAYHREDRLEANRYHILEPQKSAERVAAETLDAVLLPLLAFDLQGNRLGTGGGYYDRTFAFLRNDVLKPVRKPRLIGLAYEIQRVDQLPQEPFDIPLDGLVTEERMVIF